MAIIRLKQALFDKTHLTPPDEKEYEYLASLEGAQRSTNHSAIQDKLTKIEMNRQFIDEVQKALSTSSEEQAGGWTLDDFKFLVQQRADLIAAVQLDHLEQLRTRIAAYCKKTNPQTSDSQMLTTYLNDIDHAMKPLPPLFPTATPPDMQSLLTLEQLLSPLEEALKEKTQRINELITHCQLYHAQHIQRLQTTNPFPNDPILKKLNEQFHNSTPLYEDGMAKLSKINPNAIQDSDIQTLQRIQAQFQQLENNNVIALTDFEYRKALHQTTPPIEVMNQQRDKMLAFMEQLDRLEKQNIRYHMNNNPTTKNLLAPVGDQVRAAIALLKRELGDASAPLLQALETRILGLSNPDTLSTQPLSTLLSEGWPPNKAGTSTSATIRSRLQFDSALNITQNEKAIGLLVTINSEKLKQSIFEQIQGKAVVNLSDQLTTLNQTIATVNQHLTLATQIGLRNDGLTQISNNINTFKTEHPVHAIQQQIDTITEQFNTLSELPVNEKQVSELISLQTTVQGLRKQLTDLNYDAQEIGRTTPDNMRTHYDQMVVNFKTLFQSNQPAALNDIHLFGPSFEGVNSVYFERAHEETLEAIQAAIRGYGSQKKKQCDRLMDEFNLAHINIKSENPFAEAFQREQLLILEQRAHVNDAITQLLLSPSDVGAYAYMALAVESAKNISESLTAMSETLTKQHENEAHYLACTTLAKKDHTYVAVQTVLDAIEHRFLDHVEELKLPPNINYQGLKDYIVHLTQTDLQTLKATNEELSVLAEVYQPLLTCNKNYLKSIATTITDTTTPPNISTYKQTYCQNVSHIIDAIETKHKSSARWAWVDTLLEIIRQTFNTDIGLSKGAKQLRSTLSDVTTTLNRMHHVTETTQAMKTQVEDVRNQVTVQKNNEPTQVSENTAITPHKLP